MIRRAVATSVLLALSIGDVLAGNIYSDQMVDPRFAETSSPPHWRRIFSSGTVDEKGIAVARMPDGGYVALFSVPGGTLGSKIGLVRYTSDGALYPNLFGSSGKVIKDAQLVDLRAMTVDSQGRIVVVGTAPGPGNVKDFGVVRFKSDGSDDTTFGIGGRVAVGMEPVEAVSDDQPVAVLEQVLGGGATRLVIAGNSLMTTSSGPRQTTSLIGLRNDGSFDPDFGAYLSPNFIGRTSQRFNPDNAAYAAGLVKTPINTLLVVGTDVLSGTDTDFGACYFGSQGVPFSNACMSIAIDEPGPGGSIYDGATAAVQTAADTFVLAGNASGKMAAVRIKLINFMLQFDTSFVGSSIPNRPGRFVSAAADTYVNDVAVRSDGSLLLAGRLTSNGTQYGAITRLRPNGTPDTGPLFSSTGLAGFRAPTVSNTPSYSTEFTKVLVDAGRPVLLGSSPDNTSSAADLDGFVTRLQSDLIFASGLQ